MKQLLLGRLSLLVTMIALTACTPKVPTSETETAASETVVTQPTLVGEVEPLNLKLPECNGNNCPKLKLARLQSNQPMIDAWLDQQILMVMQQTLSIASEFQKENTMMHNSAASEVDALTAKMQLEQKLQPYISSFLYLDQELKELGANHQISLSIQPRILNDKGPFTTVVIESEDYLGGAHGSSSQQYATFNLVTHKQIVLKDLVLPNQQKQLEKVAHAAFKHWVMETKLANSVEEYEQVWKFYLSENFYLGQDGLILQYAEYEIGPYVVGFPKLVLSYQDLEGVLKPEYLPKVEQKMKQAVQ